MMEFYAQELTLPVYTQYLGDSEFLISPTYAGIKTAWIAGSVEAGDRQVIIEPKGITFSDESLQLR